MWEVRKKVIVLGCEMLAKKYERLLLVREKIDSLVASYSVSIQEVKLFGYLVNDLVFGTADFNFLIFVNQSEDFDLKAFSCSLKEIIGAEFSVEVDILETLKIRFANKLMFQHDSITSTQEVSKKSINLNQMYQSAEKFLKICQYFNDVISKNNLLEAIQGRENEITNDLFTKKQQLALMYLSHLCSQYRIFDYSSIFHSHYYCDVSIRQQCLLKFCKQFNPYFAAIKNDIEMMRRLIGLDKSYVLHYKDPDSKNTPLHGAVSNKHIGMAYVLLDEGADPFDKAYGKTVFDVIADKNWFYNLHDPVCLHFGLRLARYPEAPHNYQMHFPGYEYLKAESDLAAGMFAAQKHLLIEGELKSVADKINKLDIKDPDKFVEMFSKMLDSKPANNDSNIGDRSKPKV